MFSTGRVFQSVFLMGRPAKEVGRLERNAAGAGAVQEMLLVLRRDQTTGAAAGFRVGPAKDPGDVNPSQLGGGLGAAQEGDDV